MQIDFHHTATYAACRLAGLSPLDAGVVAHAAQYVDDATHDGALDFTDGQRYVRATSAHQMLDHANADSADNRLIWMPFHFLPGGDESAPPGQLRTDSDRFIRKMMCRPNSAVAQQMVRHCIEHRELPFAVHRFGVAMHTYVDTWAHQQFVGMVCNLNKISDLVPQRDPAYERTQVFAELSGAFQMLQQHFANALPVGHAGAVTFPDMPFLKWSFVRENGERVTRDNPTDFLEAFKALYSAAYRFRAGNAEQEVPALAAGDITAADRLFRTTVERDGEARHQVWLQSIAQGVFSFGSEQIQYIARGPGSWKFEALGEDPEHELPGHRFRPQPGFLKSNWKRFHDAIHYHRSYVLHELLPAFGLCAS